MPVVVGQKVKQGDLLFRMDDRQLRGELKLAAGRCSPSPKAELDQLENQPRPEQVAVDEARLEEADAVELEARQQLERTLTTRAPPTP